MNASWTWTAVGATVAVLVLCEVLGSSCNAGDPNG